ncbi:MAG: hypothetical protein ACK5MQ_09010 [Pikeienuella sp.]
MKRILLIPLLFVPSGAPAGALVDYLVENGVAIPTPLAPWAGGPEPGAALYESAGCAGCHADAGDFAARLTAGEMRLAIVEPRIPFPETMMPAYYTPGRFGEAPEALVGATRLSALEIEQIIAYLISVGPR